MCATPEGIIRRRVIAKDLGKFRTIGLVIVFKK